SNVTTVTLWALLLALWWCPMLAAMEWSVASARAAVVGLLLTKVVTDCFAGLLHWACDTWGDVQGPLGFLIRGFREHHVDEKPMTHHDFIEVSRSSSLGASVFLALAHILTDFSVADRSHASWVALHLLGWFLAFATVTNEVHKW